MRAHFLLPLVILVVVAGPALAQGSFSVSVVSPNPMPRDTLHPNGRFVLDVTNTGSQQDYFTIQRSEVRWSDGSPALGFPSPEFGRSLAPGETGRLWMHIDLKTPDAGTFTASIPVKSEATGATRTVSVTFEVTAADSAASASLRPRVVAPNGATVAAPALELTHLGSPFARPDAFRSDPGGSSVQVAPGRYAVRAEAPGFAGATAFVEPAAGATLDFEIRLQDVPARLSAAPTVTITDIEDSVWILAGSSDLGVVATAPMTHTQTSSAGSFYVIGAEDVPVEVPFDPVDDARHGAASQFQALDTTMAVSLDGTNAAGMDWNGALHMIDGAGAGSWFTEADATTNPHYPSSSPYRTGFFTSGATAFSPDGLRLAAGGSNGHLAMYDVASGGVLWGTDYSGEIRALRFTPDGTGLAVGAGDWEFRMVEAATGALQWSAPMEFWPFFFIAMDPEGELVATGGKHSVFHVWDAANGAERWRKDVFPGFVTGGGISQGGDRVMFSDWSYGVHYFDGDGNPIWFRDLSQAVAAMTPDGEFVLAGSFSAETGTSRLYLLDSSGSTLWTYDVPSDACTGNYSPFASRQIKSVLVTRSEDGGHVIGAASCIGGSVFQLSVPVEGSGLAPAPTVSTTRSPVSESSPPPGTPGPSLWAVVAALAFAWVRRNSLR